MDEQAKKTSGNPNAGILEARVETIETSPKANTIERCDAMSNAKRCEPSFVLGLFLCFSKAVRTRRKTDFPSLLWFTEKSMIKNY